MERLECVQLIAEDLPSDATVLGRSIPTPGLARPDYYILSNDEVSGLLGLGGPEEGWVFVGIGSPHVLHVLADVARRKQLQRIFIVDNNPAQLAHLERLIRWILVAESRTDFLESLFCGSLGREAQRALSCIPPAPKGSVRGAREGDCSDGFESIEKQFWSGFELDVDRFHEAYGRTVEKHELGLLTTQQTVGEIDLFMLTVVCGSREMYPCWPFTAGFGSGYLRDEETLRLLRRTLLGTPITFVAEDVSAFTLRLVEHRRYHPTVIWMSNLFSDWFAGRIEGISELYSTLTMLGSQTEPDFPELDLYLLQDRRSTWPIPGALTVGPVRHRHRLSVHTRTFREVSSRLMGTRCLEIVNVPNWIKQDGGVSKLPCTEYALLSDIQLAGFTTSLDTIFLHIVVGHGTPTDEFLRILPFLRAHSRRLLILEHHRWSPDFWRVRGLITPNEIRAILGQEQEMVLIAGRLPWPRNFLMVYGE